MRAKTSSASMCHQCCGSCLTFVRLRIRLIEVRIRILNIKNISYSNPQSSIFYFYRYTNKNHICTLGWFDFEYFCEFRHFFVNINEEEENIFMAKGSKNHFLHKKTKQSKSHTLNLNSPKGIFVIFFYRTGLIPYEMKLYKV